MNTKFKNMAILVLIAVSTLLCASALFAEEDHGAATPSGHHKMGHQGKEAFFKELNLTAEQEANLKTSREENMKAMKTIRDEMRKQKTALKDELSKETVDNAKVTAIASELKRLSAQMVDQRINSILSLKKVLTPEQFQKMHKNMEERMKKHEGKHGKWGKDDKETSLPPHEDEE